MPNTVVYANVIPFIGLLFAMLFMRINPLFDKKQNKMFFLSAMTLLFMLAVISVDYTVSLSELEYGWAIRRVTSFFHFSFSCFVPICLICIFANKKMKRLFYLPAALNLVICAVSMFVNWVFYFPAQGGYERGPLFLLPSFTTVFYIVYLLALSVINRRQRAYEAMFLMGVIVGLVFFIYLEVVERFFFLSWDFAASFLILYYLLLNINKSRLDPLTGANNRAMYVQKTESLNRSGRCIIAMIDINGFKAVNDTKGHAEGDRLLMHFATTAKAFTDKKNSLFRIGGDEFAVISEEESLEKFQARIEAFFIQLKEHGIHCAIGFEEYDPSVDIEHAIQAADMKMYQDKRRYYSTETPV